MSLFGRLRCRLTGSHDWQWESALKGNGTANDDGIEVEWCPRCTRVRDVSIPEDVDGVTETDVVVGHLSSLNTTGRQG